MVAAGGGARTGNETAATETMILQPRCESAAIGGRTGFSQLMSLAEEAVVQWFRIREQGPAMLRRDYGARLSVIDSSVLLYQPLSLDETVTAQVTRVGGRYFDVRLSAQREAGSIDILRGRLTVCLLPGGAGWAVRADLPPSLAGLAKDGIAGLGTAVGSHDPGHEEQALAEAAASGTLPGFPASWRARYPACDPSGWLTHGGYVRALEALADDFLAARGLLAGRLLAERGWVPAFSRARVRLLGETAVDETVQAVYSVAQVVRNSLFDGRAECHVRRADRCVPTATAILLHGYALAAGPQPGRMVELDAATIAAVTGQEP